MEIAENRIKTKGAKRTFGTLLERQELQQKCKAMEFCLEVIYLVFNPDLLYT